MSLKENIYTMKSSNRQTMCCLILDDKYGKINSHWAYSTKILKIVTRIYYDEQGYEMLVEKAIADNEIDFIGFSGRGAVEVAKRLEQYFMKKTEPLFLIYQAILKVMKYHNTNLSSTMKNYNLEKDYFYNNGNDWVRLSIDHPFDLALIQTYGDAEIINRINNNKKAVWVPFSYNDRLFYERTSKKTLDIGAFFKLERHSHRISFINSIKNIADKYGYSFEFSDKYWGEAYAKKISQTKVIVHLSYCGDIPWRLYECAASNTCLLTDKLGFGIEKLFPQASFVEYNKDLSNLESQIVKLIENEKYRNRISGLAMKAVQKYAWGEFTEKRILPIISKYLAEKRKKYVLYKA